jgi:hypothetical protein
MKLRTEVCLEAIGVCIELSPEGTHQQYVQHTLMEKQNMAIQISFLVDKLRG